MDVEILRHNSTKRHDLRRKRGWYAEAGVAEYWIMDPAARSVEVLVPPAPAQAGGGYQTDATAGGAVASAALAGFEPGVDALFHRPAFG